MDIHPLSMVETVAARPHDHLADIFRSQPTDWLRSFLVLAISSAGKVGLAPPPRMSYDLGPQLMIEPERSSFRFVWEPHCGCDLFDAFKGAFVLTGHQGETGVRLEGRTSGGGHQLNRTVLKRLVELIGAAASAA